MSAYVEELLGDFDRGLVVPFVQVDATTNRVVGVTGGLRASSHHPSANHL